MSSSVRAVMTPEQEYAKELATRISELWVLIESAIPRWCGHLPHSVEGRHHPGRHTRLPRDLWR
jgi:hypothetical protein